MALLDEGRLLKPSPYFMTRLKRGCGKSVRGAKRLAGTPDSPHARRLRLWRGGPSASVGRWRWTVMLLIGGGTYLGVTDWNHPEPAPPAQTAVVHDLQLLDSNQQILDQLESMSGNQKTAT